MLDRIRALTRFLCVSGGLLTAAIWLGLYVGKEQVDFAGCPTAACSVSVR